MNDKEKLSTLGATLDSWYDSVVDGLLEFAMENSMAYTTIVDSSVDDLALLVDNDYNSTLKGLLKAKINGEQITSIDKVIEVLREITIEGEQEQTLALYQGNAEVLKDFFKDLGDDKRYKEMRSVQYIK